MPLPVRSSDTAFNPEIERLLFQVKVVQSDADGITYDLSDEQFNWRPSDRQWSVGQCFDHLNRTNRVFLSNLRESIARGRSQGLLDEGPFAYNWFSRWFLRLVDPSSPRKFKAPGKFVPPAHLNLKDVMPEFQSLHDQLNELLKEASGLDLVRNKVSSLFPLLKFNLGMTFWIVTTHDRRHIAQARAVRNTAGFP